MGDPAMRNDSTVTPPHVVTPFLPQTPTPSTSDVDQMIRDRVNNAVENLKYEFSRTAKEQRNREFLIGIGGGIAGVALVGIGRWAYGKLQANNQGGGAR